MSDQVGTHIFGFLTQMLKYLVEVCPLLRSLKISLGFPTISTEEAVISNIPSL